MSGWNTPPRTLTVNLTGAGHSSVSNPVVNSKARFQPNRVAFFLLLLQAGNTLSRAQPPISHTFVVCSVTVLTIVNRGTKQLPIKSHEKAYFSEHVPVGFSPEALRRAAGLTDTKHDT